MQSMSEQSEFEKSDMQRVSESFSGSYKSESVLMSHAGLTSKLASNSHVKNAISVDNSSSAAFNNSQEDGSILKKESLNQS